MIKNIFGLVGTGKTEELIKNVDYLLNNEIDFCILTFTRSARDNIKMRLEKKGIDLKDVEILTAHQKAFRLLQLNKNQIFEKNYEKLEEFKNLLKQKTKLNFNPKQIKIVYDSIQKEKGNLYFDFYNYLRNSEPYNFKNTETIRKRLIEFNKIINRNLNFDIYLQFEDTLTKFLNENDLITFSDMLVEALKIASREYNYVLIDEAQDCTNSIFNFASKLGKVILYGDLAQRIFYSFGDTKETIEYMLKDYEFKNVNFRTPLSLSHLLKKYGKVIYEKKYKVKLKNDFVFNSNVKGKYEFIKRSSNIYNDLYLAIELAKNEIQKNKNVTILVRLNSTLLKLEKILTEDYNIPFIIKTSIDDYVVNYQELINAFNIAKTNFQILQSSDGLIKFSNEKEFIVNEIYKNIEGAKIKKEKSKRLAIRNFEKLSNLQKEDIKLTISTIHSFKGFENDVIICLIEYSRPRILELKELELYYTGITRAREKLYLISDYIIEEPNEIWSY